MPSWLFCFVLGTSIAPGPAAARTWHIRPDGAGDAPTIQAGIDSAQAGDTVLLAPGTYTWSSQGGSGETLLQLKPGVTLRGENGAGDTVLDAETQGRLLLCVNVGAVLIEGLTFTNGRSLGLDDTEGGAIDVLGSSTPTIRGCVFRDNHSSGGIARGGAVHCDVATIEDCDFIDNKAGVSGLTNGFGGALYCGAATVRGCNFVGNEGLGYEATGGGAVRSSSATFTDCSFADNFIECPGLPSGGAVVDRGEALFERCEFRNNVAFAHYFSADGGAVRVGFGTFRDCLFIDNTARSTTSMARGGALTGSDMLITGCVFINNSAYQMEPLGPGFGGAVYAHFTSTLESCTLVGNSGGTEAGVGGFDLQEGGTVHRVIVSHTAVGRTNAGPAHWSCSLLFANADGNVIAGTDGGGNLRTNPLFCSDPLSSGKVSIRSDSPCAGLGSCGRIGAGQVECEQVTVETSTWSAIKGRYRSRP